MNEIIISQIRQRLEILYQMVDELEKSGGGGGEPGTTNYNDLTNKPSVNGHILIGSKTSSDLDLQPVISDLSTIRSGAALGATAVQPSDMEEALATLPVDQIETNKNNISNQQNTTASGGNGYALINGIRLYVASSAPTGDIPDGSVGVGW